ncbi:PTS mannose/fructose/sorbose/N-acetylgalactosamine transporter subunit IIC [Aneurinibacillus terranovensis]|uniref:PTS mannose/fructose/sorbose/N-acetylgalactosamine transporter subunit IIC n=1 Tax=Aneurinibacillus terranovensis TaxID=278991 RepID=UPI00040935A9|nr:PTS sugar transporter subunit IIC [Aneurinibacillus terranovensis]
MHVLLVALLVAIVAGILEWDIYGWGQTMISRPVVAGPIMGLILGDMKTGLYIGATIEMMYLGTIPVGAAIPPDPTAATAIATSIAILSGIDPKAAPALAVPVAMAAQSLQMLIWTGNVGLTHKADKYAEAGNIKGMEKIHITGSFLFFLQGFVPAFVATLFGVSAVKLVIQHIPTWFMNGLTVAGGMLPALGFAMLFTMMSSKKLLPYFIIGFVVAAFFKATLIAAAALGVGAMLLHLNKFEKSEA